MNEEIRVMDHIRNEIWTRPTIEPEIAVTNLISCLQHYKNAWIEMVNNCELERAITIINPELDNPFNWEFAYGTYETKNEIDKLCFINETEKDLTYNWIHGFGSAEAVKKYQSNREITKGLMLSVGVCSPIRIEDAQKYRDLFVKDGYKYKYPSASEKTWISHWRPKEGVKYWVPDPNIGKVFVVFFNTDPVDRKSSLLRASDFLRDCAAMENK